MARAIEVVSTPKRVAVVGGGWGGLAAAVEASELGHQVFLFEMARHAGGRARSVQINADTTLDNGQHILIGAYTDTLRMMRRVGVDPERALLRQPLEIRYPDGSGLRMARGPASFAFALAVLSADSWTLSDRWTLLRTAFAWWRNGLRNPGVRTVAELCAPLPERVRTDLMEPLCIAALNTPSAVASADVFLRVLSDALFGPRGSSDLLLPRLGLSTLFPNAALTWLRDRGHRVEFGHRVQRLLAADGRWLVDDEPFDFVVLACSAFEAARLSNPIAPRWAASAEALRYEPIATVYLQRSAAALHCPMVTLRSSPKAPAQFAIDLGSLGVAARTVAFVVSGARTWLEQGPDRLATAVGVQALSALPAHFPRASAPLLHTSVERRATFACTAGLARPPTEIAPGLVAAGDYIAGPYPATLEGAVRSGILAARTVSAGSASLDVAGLVRTLPDRASTMQKSLP